MFAQFDNGEIEKQSDPQYMMKTAEEKLEAECQSIVVVKPKTERIVLNQDEGHLSSKKRKRDSPERYVHKEETTFHLEQPAPPKVDYLYKATRHPDDEVDDFAPMEMSHNPHFGNNDIKTDSMMIEELLEADRKKPIMENQDDKQGDQTWDNFCKNADFKTRPENDTPSKAAEPLVLENGKNINLMTIYLNLTS